MILYQCSLTYRSGLMAGRDSHASGEAEWSERGVGNLTRAAYATAYDVLNRNRQFQAVKRNTRVALRGVIPCGVSSHHVLLRAFGDALFRT